MSIMNRKGARASALAGLALATLALTGCVAVDNGPKDTDRPQPTATEKPAAKPKDEPPAEDAEPDESKREEATTVDLAPEQGRQYLFAIQAFSPLLESWVVDEAAGELVYTRHTCVGGVDAQGMGVLEGHGDGRWTATWVGESPMYLSAGPSEELVITDKLLTYGGGDSASAFTDFELEKFRGMCKKAGKAVAEFVLG